MTGDRGIRRLTAAAGRDYRGCGQFHPHPEPGRDARADRASCLASPRVSVDGTVAGASLSMLWAARSGLSTPWLARCMLTLGMLWPPSARTSATALPAAGPASCSAHG